MKARVLSYLFTMACLAGDAQDTTGLPKKITFSGYLKILESVSFDKSLKDVVPGTLFHNRINARWKPTEKITVAADLRNRIYWGEEVRRNPGMAGSLRNDNEKVNMQIAWIKNRSLLAHSNVERLYFDFRDERVNFRFGRQRVNWGMSTTWNPNDIFNAYNFLDVDYEERPGVDGAKFQYVFGPFFKAELAYGHNGKKNDADIAAIRCSFNKWEYDFQFITGWYQSHSTFGLGWAGRIKDAGFKGEVQYFVANRDSTDHLNISIETNYIFEGGWFLTVGTLFNKRGLSASRAGWQEYDFRFSPDNLMPTKWNLINTLAKEFTPLFTTTLTVLYAPGSNLLLVFPSLQYNLATNLDLNFVWQSFFAELANEFTAVNHRSFLRLKWSF